MELIREGAYFRNFTVFFCYFLFHKTLTFLLKEKCFFFDCMTAAITLNWHNMDLQKHNHRCSNWLISFAAAQAGVMQCSWPE